MTTADSELQAKLEEVQRTQDAFWDALLDLETDLWLDNPAVNLSSEEDYSNWTLDTVKAAVEEIDSRT